MEEPGNETRLPIPWGAVIYAAIILAAIATVLLIRSFVIEPFSIPTESMCDTLQVGDSVLAEKITLELGGTVSAGDVIVFENPEKGSEKDVLCKRVVACAGQTGRYEKRIGLYRWEENHGGLREGRFLSAVPREGKADILSL